MSANIMVTDGLGSPLCSLNGLTFIQHRITPIISPSRPLDIILQPMQISSTVLLNHNESEAISAVDSAVDSLRSYLASIGGQKVLRILITREGRDLLHALCFVVSY